MAGRRSSFGTSTATVSEAINDSAYDNVKTVADNIGNVNTVGSALDAGTFDVVTANVADVVTVANNIASVVTAAGIAVEIQSVVADKITLDSLYADKATLDSLFSDKVTLDSLFADKAALDSLYQDKVKLDRLYTSIANIDTITPSIENIDTVASSINSVNTAAANIADINAVVVQVIPNLAEILSVDNNAALVSNLYDQFDDRYLGSKEIEPVVDNDGDVLLVGALYFDSVLNKMREWSGTQWQDSLTLTAGSISDITNKTLDSITNTVGADHVHYKVRNASGATIPVGTVIAAMGTQPGTDYIQVVPVTNPQTQVAIGIVHTELLNNDTGLCISRGIQDNTNTGAWAVGTILYPDVNGNLTTVKPTSGMYQACAYVLRQHSSSGTLLVNFIEPKAIASTTQVGEVQLNDTLTSTSTVQALTANQGKILQDRLVIVENNTVQEGDSVTLTGDVTGTATFGTTGNLSIETTVLDGSHNHVISNIDELQTTLDTKINSNALITAGTSTKITYDSKGLVTSGTTLSATDIPNLDASKITSGTIDAARLPAYVDDVLEYANLTGFPATGETGKIYVAIDTNKTYRWSGSVYVYITSGAVDSVAGKTGVVTLVKADVGLVNVDNTSDVNKPVSTAQAQAITNSAATKLDLTVANASYIGRADKYLAAQAVVNMIYSHGKLSKVRYNNNTDVDYEILTYNATTGKLDKVAHYVASKLAGNTVLSYTDGKLVSAIYTGV